MPTDDVHEERMLLHSLITSDYPAFKGIVLGDALKTLPSDKSYDDLIEDYLRKKWGGQYEPPKTSDS